MVSIRLLQAYNPENSPSSLTFDGLHDSDSDEEAGEAEESAEPEDAQEEEIE